MNEIDKAYVYMLLDQLVETAEELRSKFDELEEQSDES